MVGDVFERIDGVDSTGMAVVDCMQRLRGPDGSSVRVTLKRQTRSIEVTIVGRATSTDECPTKRFDSSAAAPREPSGIERTTTPARIIAAATQVIGPACSPPSAMPSTSATTGFTYA